MRTDGTVFYPTFASHVVCGHAKAAAPVVDCTEQVVPKLRFVSLLPPPAAALSAPAAKGRLRLVCKPAPYDEAQRS